MTELDADVLIVGSGFAGSLTALLVKQIGLRPVVVDRGSHPRFVIGESTTPVANLVLESLSRRFDLPWLTPLAA
ncbi:MAG TPA: FAD-dependent monooxygenase, partial [Planctomycetaceae bacterium]|nr:FAD-dependent monooxygenase [Planctomycetaceae bacterium]